MKPYLISSEHGMDLYFFRHGAAMPAPPGGSDAGRILTEEGRKAVCVGGKGLLRIGVNPDRILTSPLLRARETATLLAESLDSGGETELVNSLLPDADPRGFLAELARSSSRRILCVGHLPFLPRCISFCISGTTSLPFEMEPASSAHVAFEGGPRPGAGVLVWVLPPPLLRALA